jgi:Cu-Zn family superoxide dismutase
MSRSIHLAAITAIACALYACDRADRGQGTDPGAMKPPVETNTQAAQTPPATAQPQVLAEDPGAADPKPVAKAVALVSPTKGKTTHGTVTFTTRQGGGVDVKAELAGLPKGKHAYHVHQFGDCSGDEGDTAGTHFNFQGSSQNPGEHIDRITGNLGELDVGADGKAMATATIEKASLQGAYSIIGRSVVVHEKGNDPKSPPMGAAGGRLGCGVIGIAAGDSPGSAAVIGRMKKP